MDKHDIQLRGELVDNDTADVLRFWGWRDITAPMDIAAALAEANGAPVTLLVNSPGGSMVVGNEIRSMLRRYGGETTALYQGYGASAATLAACGCRRIVAEPGALLCYHNPSCVAEGDYRAMEGAAEAMKIARDCIVEVYKARQGTKSAEELRELMDRDIWITPSMAKEYGLIDAVEGLSDGDSVTGAGAMVASVHSGPRVTEAMREAYRDHVAAEQKAADENERADRILAQIRVLGEY